VSRRQHWHAAKPTAPPRSGIDAAAFGLRPNAADDQSKALQRAIDRAASDGAVLQLRAGTYLAGGLQLPTNATIAGVGGATRIVMLGGPSMLMSTGCDHVSLSGLIFDGANIPLPRTPRPGSPDARTRVAHFKLRNSQRWPQRYRA
jgi:uncharacterized secreted repeat protein (TIGR03808 family)